MSNKQVFASNEIVGAFLSNSATAEDIKSLETDPKSFILAKANIDLQGDFSLVENSDDTINLVLPYYSEIQKMSAVELTAEQMEDISGGEIIGLIIMGLSLVGCTVASAVGVSAIGTTAAAVVGGCVVGGVAAATVAGSAALIGGAAAAGRAAGRAKKGRK